MRVKIASHSGFCFGVKRAIKIAEETLRRSKDKGNIYSLNPIIHNPQVVSDLSKKGLRVLRDISKIKKGTVVISSHGAPIEVIDRLKKKKLKIVDATCPFVKHAHDIVKGLKAKGYRVIVIGDKEHPEVKALLSVAGKATKSRKIGIVSQTTQSRPNYIKGISEVLKNDFSEVRIFNTICNDTAERQILTRGLLNECDVMVVVGGRNSANTRSIFDICKESGVDSYHIETKTDLKKGWFVSKKCAGVVSGASTPESTVKKVVAKIS